MDLDGAKEFLSTNHRAVLATARADGRPQLSPVTVVLDAGDRVLISTREAAMKTHNLRRDPRAFLCILSDGFYGQFVQLEGTAEIISLPAAMEGLVDYYRRAAGEHPDWDDYRAAMGRDRRVLVRIAIESVGPQRSG